MSFAFGFVATLCLIGVIYLSSQDKPGLTLTAFIAGLALVATLNFRYDIKAIWFIIALVLFTATAAMSYFLGKDLENIDFDKPTYLQVFFVLGTALLFMAWAITQIGISTLNPLKAFAAQPLVLPNWLIEVFNRAYFILNGPSRLAFFISAALLILSFIPLVLFAKLVPVRRVLGRIVIVSAVVWFGTMLLPTKVNAQILDPNTPPTEVAVAATDAPVEATYPAEATMTAIMPTDTPIPTASPLPQPTFTPITSTATPIPPTATLVPTAAPRDFSEYPSCLDTTETQHPDDGHTLINIPNPFPGARLEIEIYSKVDCVLTLNPGEYANMAWWSHGPYDDNKTLSKPCLNGPKCEGVAVLFRTDIIPAYEIVHVYIYLNGSDAVISFLGSNNDSPEERGYWNDGQSSSFACRTLKNSLIYGYHDNQNIVVPDWAKDAASIFYHTGCEGFDGKPGKDNPEPATDAVCAAPQSENWLWNSGGFWYHDGLEINFTVPMGISKVLYRTTDSGYPYIVAMTGESVSGATYAYAYCNNE